MPENTKHYTSKEVISAYSVMLFSYLKSEMTPIKKNVSYETDTDHIFYVSYGYAIITQNKKLFTISLENEFIGLHNIFGYTKCPISLTLKDLSKESIILKIEKDKALDIIEKNSLYKPVSFLLHDRLYGFSFYLDLMSKVSTYEKIKIGIEYYEKNQAIIRKVFSLPKYLTDITRTSKSRVMSILAELKKGKYIHIDENGFITILRKLPDSF